MEKQFLITPPVLPQAPDFNTPHYSKYPQRALDSDIVRESKSFYLEFPQEASKVLVHLALLEDLGSRGDVTSQAIFTSSHLSQAKLIAKEDGVLCGQKIVDQIFEVYGDKTIQIDWFFSEGALFKTGDCLLSLYGNTQSILECERTLLNFLQRFCAIATKTHSVVTLLANSNIILLDTRKTLPGYRLLDKYSVLVGGGANHRQGLFDQVLIKDNHADACGSVKLAADCCANQYSNEPMIIQAEVRTFSELQSLLPGPTSWILLDNMSYADMQTCIQWIRNISPQVKIEASGNITPERLETLVDLDLDYISMGALTHSVSALDLSLQLEHSTLLTS